MFSTIAAVTDMNFDIAIGALTGAMPHTRTPSLDSSVCVRVVDLMVVMDWGTNNAREQEQEGS